MGPAEENGVRKANKVFGNMFRWKGTLMKKIATIVAVFLLITDVANAATLVSGSCRLLVTMDGAKYVGTYCMDFSCSVTTNYIFDTLCPFSI